MPASIDVVIPTFGGWPLTESCLRHLRAQTAPHRVIVVDNASTDGTPERVAASFPEAEVVALERNLGFAAACNRGAAAGQAEVVVLLNNDVDCEPDFLGRVAAALEAAPAAASAAPLLLRSDRAVIDSVGLCADSTLAGFPRLQGHPPADAQRASPRLVGPSGAAAAYRRDALERAGGLDERIFFYQEDLDLALRLRAAGHDAVAAPEAVAVHAGSATAGRRSMWQRRQSGFSRGYLLRRYDVLNGSAGPRALLTEAIVVLGDAAISRDLSALRGRLAGWRTGREADRLSVPACGLDRTISLWQSLQLRRADYAR
ncbi:MAG: glycosyltransferase [Actinomycetota bacterium]|nr:glycosyltransferase [Actinomycetota bacterium]